MLCENCGVREATKTWVGDMGVLGWVHGGGQQWCTLCAVRAQLAYAREQAARIPELEKDLAALEKS